MWLILILLLLGLLAYLDTRKPKNFPPGPAWLPFVGCALQLYRLHLKTGHLTKATQVLAARYGSLVGTRVGREHLVFVCGLEAIEEMFTREEFNARPDGILATSRTGGRRRGILFTDSKLFQDQRRFVQKQLKEFGFRKEVMSENIDRGARAIIDDVKKKTNRNGVVAVNSLFAEQLLQTTWALLAGNESFLDDSEVRELHRAMENFSRCATVSGTAFSNFPFLKRICPEYCGYNAYVNAHKNILEFARRKIHGLRKPTVRLSLIGAYLEVLSGPEKTDNFDEEQLLAICLDLFLTGFETLQHALEFAIFYLVLHPDVQRKAQKELDGVVGSGRLPSLEDKPRLPYIESITMETIRLYGGRSFLVPRRATRDTTFNGYFIPKGTILLGSLRSVFMDPNGRWANPSVFDPERFLKDGNLNVPSDFIPFALGKRRCLGEILARANLFLILACLLQTFNFKAVPGNPPKLEIIENLSPTLKPFKAVVSLRKPVN
ncbi:probable cytochrome P450 303a1 [Photinus pyralis]|uniref:probable cytochrome P450 303a1 n=1 Tax=Photinus pyralis TaxID=7054 RepID=UPI001267200A|nr:probable cytochrome P450 303a1 [Photinus pyralis]